MITAAGAGRDEFLPDYILRHRLFTNDKSPAVATHLAALRYMHVLAGYPACASPGEGYETLIREVRIGVATDRKLPFNVDLIWRIRKFYGENSSNGIGIKRLRGANVARFFSLLLSWGRGNFENLTYVSMLKPESGILRYLARRPQLVKR